MITTATTIEELATVGVIPTRTYTALKNGHLNSNVYLEIFTVADIVKCSERELTKLKGLGFLGARGLAERLAQHGFPLKPSPVSVSGKPLMKTAKKVVVSVELNCPYCEGTIPAPCGSLFWEVIELPSPGTPLTCFHCKKESKCPKG